MTSIYSELQIPDNIHIGKVHLYLQPPKIAQEYLSLFEERSSYHNCERGYIATWKIIDDTIFLDYSLTYRQVFGGNEYDIKASWLFATLQISISPVIYRVINEWYYPRRLLINVEKGSITKIELEEDEFHERKYISLNGYFYIEVKNSSSKEITLSQMFQVVESYKDTVSEYTLPIIKDILDVKEMYF